MSSEIAALIPAAFIAGLVTFLAPCTLPLVPAYLAFITSKSSRHNAFFNTTLYVMGFSFVFILFGMVSGSVGGSLPLIRDILRIFGGLFIIAIGTLNLTEIVIPLRSFNLLKIVPRGTPESSFFVGVSFALGWTPCVGPILASLLFLATSSPTAFEGGMLLAVFSAGLGVPFLLIGMGVGRAERFIEKNATFFYLLYLLGSLALIAIGILLLTNRFDILIRYGFSLFNFLNYEQILRYL